MAATSARMRRIVLRPLILCLFLLSGCVGSGNGDAYLGGDLKATAAQVEDAYQRVEGDLMDVMKDIVAHNVGNAQLIADPNCNAQSSRLCMLSNLFSPAKREAAARLILEQAPNVIAALSQKRFSVKLAPRLPLILDPYGHARDVGAAISGNVITFALDVLMRQEPAMLRPVMAGLLFHEILHGLLTWIDSTSWDAFTSPEGVREAFTFAGNIVGNVLLSRLKEGAPTRRDLTSGIIDMAGIPGGAVAGPVATIRYHAGIWLVGVGREDKKIYANYFNGTGWQGFRLIADVESAATSVGAVEYRTPGGAYGAMLAVASGGYIVPIWCWEFRCEAQPRIDGKLLSATTPTFVFTQLAPSMSVYDGYLLYWMTGTAGPLYWACATAKTSPWCDRWNRTDRIANYSDAFAGPTSSQAPAVTSSSSGIQIVRIDTNGVPQQNWHTTTTWGGFRQAPYRTTLAPYGNASGSTFYIAYLDSQTQKAVVATHAAGNYTPSQSVEMQHGPTSVRPAVVYYNGIRVFTVTADGTVEQSHP